MMAHFKKWHMVWYKLLSSSSWLGVFATLDGDSPHVGNLRFKHLSCWLIILTWFILADKWNFFFFMFRQLCHLSVLIESVRSLHREPLSVTSVWNIKKTFLEGKKEKKIQRSQSELQYKTSVQHKHFVLNSLKNVVLCIYISASSIKSINCFFNLTWFILILMII